LAEPFRPHGCGNIIPLGITGAPVYDPASQTVYVVAEDSTARHVLYGLAASDGHVASQVEVDPPFGTRDFLQQRPALTLWHGHVFAVFGGLSGDCGDYTGAVASVDLASGSVKWFAASTSGRGGMWAPGEPAVGTDRLYFSVGNGNTDDPAKPFDGTDSVVALDTDAKRVDFFAPASWAADNQADADLGSMNPLLAAGRVIIAGKSGQGYLLDPARLGGIGAAGAQAFPACAAFGQAAADGDVVYLPCADGTRAYRIGGGTSGGNTVTPLWHTPKANGQPVLGGGRLWVANWDDGVLLALDPATGAVGKQVPVGALPHFAKPTIVGDKVFVGTMDGLAITPL
jgi:YVTN family beta-propeller protein